MEVGIASIFLQGGVLCLLMYYFARDEADYDFQKVAMVVALITFINFMLHAGLEPKIGPFVLLVELAVIVILVQKFCWLPWKRGLIVGVILMAFNAGLSFALAKLVHRIDEGVDKNMGGTMIEQQQAEGWKVLGELRGDINRMNEPTAEELRESSQQVAPADSPAPDPRPGAQSISASASYDALRPDLAVPEGDDGTEWVQARDQIIVAGKLRDPDGNIVALINGRMVNRGERMSIRLGERRYIFKLSVLTQNETVWEPLRSEVATD